MHDTARQRGTHCSKQGSWGVFIGTLANTTLPKTVPHPSSRDYFLVVRYHNYVQIRRLQLPNLCAASWGYKLLGKSIFWFWSPSDHWKRIKLLRTNSLSIYPSLCCRFLSQCNLDVSFPPLDQSLRFLDENSALVHCLPHQLPLEIVTSPQCATNRAKILPNQASTSTLQRPSLDGVMLPNQPKTTLKTE